LCLWKCYSDARYAKLRGGDVYVDGWRILNLKLQISFTGSLGVGGGERTAVRLNWLCGSGYVAKLLKIKVLQDVFSLIQLVHSFAFHVLMNVSFSNQSVVFVVITRS
jgi:hypothetical protein